MRNNHFLLDHWLKLAYVYLGLNLYCKQRPFITWHNTFVMIFKLDLIFVEILRSDHLNKSNDLTYTHQS